MSANTAPSEQPGGDELQFDRAVPAARDNAPSDAMACTSCAAVLRTWYYDVDGRQLCTACKNKVAAASGPARDWSTTLRAALFGLAAAVAGAIIYYGVIAITNFEIGIVALLIGYMVGFSVRKGSRGRGGRRLQLTAAALTYFSVALAYLPLAMKGAVEGAATAADSSAMAGDSLPGEQDPNAAASASSDSPALGSTPATAVDVNPFFSVAMLIAFALALPLLVVFGTLPSGLISALIIGIGMRQAWVMTRAAEVTVAGPFKVGARTGDAQSAGPAASAA